jgi:hypothetical protein
MVLAAQMRADALNTELSSLREAHTALIVRSRLVESANAARFHTWCNAVALVEQRLAWSQQSSALYHNVVASISEERKYLRAIISRCKCPAALSPGDANVSGGGGSSHVGPDAGVQVGG